MRIILTLLILLYFNNSYAAESVEILELKKTNLELVLQVLELSWKEKKRELDDLSKQLEQEKAKVKKTEKK